MKLVVIVPTKNEEKNLENVIKSLLIQTFQPVLCVFVDDGSTDKTPEIINTYIQKSKIIDYIKLEGQKEYILGGHVVSVFYKGKDYIEKSGIDYDYIIKLDADISFDNEFFANMVKILEVKEYGIASGTPYYYEGHHKIYDKSPRFHSKGQFKFYNKKCLEDIGTIPYGLGWDTADNIKAIDKNWETTRLDELEYLMHRKIGGKYSLKKGRIKHGSGAYNLRYSSLYLIFRIAHDLLKPPIIIGSIYFSFGYFKSFFSKQERVLTQNQGKILRKILWKHLFRRFASGELYLFQKLRTIFKIKNN